MLTERAGPSAETLSDAALIASKVFDAMEWRWGGIFDESHQPDAEELLARFTQMVDDVVAEDDYVLISGGRLAVYRDRDLGSVRLLIQVGELDA